MVGETGSPLGTKNFSVSGLPWGAKERTAPPPISMHRPPPLTHLFNPPRPLAMRSSPPSLHSTGFAFLGNQFRSVAPQPPSPTRSPWVLRGPTLKLGCSLAWVPTLRSLEAPLGPGRVGSGELQAPTLRVELPRTHGCTREGLRARCSSSQTPLSQAGVLP